MKTNDLGKTFLVEECQKIEINTFLRVAKLRLKESLINSELDIQGVVTGLLTSKTGFGGIRYWFKCPSCYKRVGTLFMHAISQKLACRVCLGLEYRKRKYKGMVENSSL
jgi:hypothetical protein